MIRDHTWDGQRQAVASCDCDRLLTFLRGAVHGELDSDSVLQRGCHRETLEKGSWSTLSRDPMCSCPASKGTKLKAQFAPIEYI